MVPCGIDFTKSVQTQGGSDAYENGKDAEGY